MIPRFVIGSMNVRAMLQEYTVTTTPAGGREKTWADVQEVWVNVTSAKGREEVFGMQIRATSTHVITMRYREVNEKMRLVIKGVNYNIQSIDDVEYRGRKLVLGVERGVGT